MSIKIITEIASTHNGNPKVIDFLTKKHMQSGSDYIKYQIFKSEKLIDKHDQNFKKFKKIEISFKMWKKIIEKFKKKTSIILEIFDEESYYFCKQFKKDVYLKISTSELDNFKIIDDAIKNFKIIFLNVSGYDEIFIKKLIKKYFTKTNKKKLIILYGFQGFPSQPDELRLGLFNYLKKNKIIYGFSDHSIFGLSKDFLSILPIIFNKEVQFFEKHICKKISKKTPDYISSLEYKEFKKFVNIVKKYNGLKKKNLTIFTPAEKKYSKVMHKFAFAKQNIKKKEIINLEKIIFLRSSKKNGLRREFFNKYKLLISNKFHKKGSMLNFNSVKI